MSQVDDRTDSSSDQTSACIFLRRLFKAGARETLEEAVRRTPLSMNRERNAARRLLLKESSSPERRWQCVLQAARLLGWRPSSERGGAV